MEGKLNFGAHMDGDKLEALDVELGETSVTIPPKEVEGFVDWLIIECMGGKSVTKLVEAKTEKKSEPNPDDVLAERKFTKRVAGGLEVIDMSAQLPNALKGDKVDGPFTLPGK